MKNKSPLEQKIFFMFPIPFISAIVSYGFQFGWEQARLEWFIFLAMGVAAWILYFLVKHLALMFSRWELNMMNNDHINESIKTLSLKHKISFFASVLGAFGLYLWGLIQGIDMVILFSWCVFGWTAASEIMGREVSARRK